MSLSRKFLNLIVDHRIPGASSLRCIDLTRDHLFNITTRPQPPNGSECKGLPADVSDQKNKQAGKAALTMEMIQLPGPIFNFQASTMTTHLAINCFPLAGREVLCADQHGRTFLFDVDTRNVVTMPDLQKPKRWPLSLFVPSAGVDGSDDSGSGSLFIMETVPKHSDQFEAFIYCKPTMTSSCQPLPPPPFICDPKFSDRRTKISSYAVVNDGSEICISVDGAGTYCLDTVKHTWRHVGEWTLPFHGKVEYVPELKLWFGLSAHTQHLAAADLSTIDSQPELVKTWNELIRRKEWRDSQDSQLVNLGSGRFCIARFFHTRNLMGYSYDQIIEDHFAVLTGVDVVRCVKDNNGNGNDNNSGSGNAKGIIRDVELQMIKHKWKLHVSNDSSMITTVF